MPLVDSSHTVNRSNSYGSCADRQDTTTSNCSGLKICVQDGTTSIDRVRQLFPDRFIVAKASGDEAAQGLATGDCNAIAGGIFDVAISNIRDIGNYAGPYEHGNTTFSKEPLALVTRQDDPQWSAFVYWVVTAIFYAEEEGITSDSAAIKMPNVNLFGLLYFRMFESAIVAVGSYGQIYDRHVQGEFARAGLNQLNTNPLHAQHFSLPGLDI
jgi:hypothetical protein